MPGTPASATADPSGITSPPLDATAGSTPDAKPAATKEPKAGDFNAGGKARFPSGPDEAGQYATWNWVAADLTGRYYLLPSVTLTGNAPLAIIKPDNIMGGAIEPKMFGGMSVTFEAVLPKLPDMPLMSAKAKDTKIGLSLTAAYMREGAMLLSERDFPLFTGDLKPGLAGGLITILKVSSLVDFSFVPTFVFQSGTAENLTALQVPLMLALKVGSLVKLSTDLGIYTGDNISLRPSNGGRISLGAALDVKIGPILAHAGAGFASLLTDEMGLYPTIGESMYVDVNVKYAK